VKGNAMPAKKDLTNQVFGKLKVIEEAGRSAGSGDVLWLVECECKIRKIVRAHSLLNGRTKSCGSHRHKEDLTGKIFGRLRVIRENGRSHYGILWEVECQCVNKTIKNIPTNHLINGNTKSCGCLKRELTSLRKKNNLEGKIFGKLKVIEDAGRTDDGRILWLVECQCANKTRKIVLGSNLIGGKIVSCGCHIRSLTSSLKRKILTNQIFGRLKVIGNVGKDQSGGMLWLVECQCANKTRKIVSSGNLVSGKVKSCGCSREETYHKRVNINNCFNEYIHLIDPNEFLDKLTKGGKVRVVERRLKCSKYSSL
jgi:hypothetical protein